MATRNSHSFGYALRLHYPWQYKRFFSNSQVIRLSECTIFRVPNDVGHFRLGITLKARGSSVERNKTKRQIREQFRLLRPLLGSFDYNVVIPGHKKLSFPFPEKLGRSIQSELPRALENR